MEDNNRQLFQSHGALFTLSDTTATSTLSISTEHAQNIYRELAMGYGRAIFEGYVHGELYVAFKTSSKREQFIVFNGYDSYAFHQGDKQDETAALNQKKTTSVISGKELPRISKAMPALTSLVDFVKESYPGMDISFVDVLRQSSDGMYGSKEALFDWHKDNDSPERSKVTRTVIFLLSDTKSSMQVCGFDEVHYKGQGSGIGFMADMWHRSGFAEPGTMKIAFFLTGKCKVIPNTSLCVCGQVNPPSKKRGWVEENWFQCDKCDRWCHEICALKKGTFRGDNFYCCE